MNEIMNVEPTRDVGLSGRGPVAYDFAPRRLRRGHGHDHASDEEEQDSVPVPAPPVLRQRPAPAPSRLTQGVERWCECTCCQRMPSESEIENVCCREVKFEKMTIPEDATCITHHEDFVFEKVCLSPAVLEMAMPYCSEMSKDFMVQANCLTRDTDTLPTGASLHGAMAT